jgi:hypothetical protein
MSSAGSNTERNSGWRFGPLPIEILYLSEGTIL